MKLFAGKKGIWYDSKRGKIYCSKAPREGIDSRLYRILCDMVDECHLSVVINSVDTGKHVPTSRHYQGRAVDMNDIHVYGQPPEPVSVDNPHAVTALRWLVAHGFTAGHENGPYDAVILGPADSRWNQTNVPHNSHMHASVKA